MSRPSAAPHEIIEELSAKQERQLSNDVRAFLSGMGSATADGSVGTPILELPRTSPEPISSSLDWWDSEPDELLPETKPMTKEMLKETLERGRTRHTLIYTAPGSEEKFLLHVSPETDVLVQGAFGELSSADGLVPQKIIRLNGSDMIVALREVVDRTLAEDLERLDKDSTSDASFSMRIQVLRMVLVGLASLHRRNLVHGNLRPENVTLNASGHARLIDYSMRPPLEQLTPEQQRYVAPEARESATTAASDIFAFGKLAQRLVGPYLWDSRVLPNELRTDAFEWILDYCTLESPEDRPDVATLSAVMFGDNLSLVRARALRALSAGRREVIQRIQEIELGNRGLLAGAIDAATVQIRSLVDHYPETLLAIRTARKSAALVERFALDIGHHHPTSLHEVGAGALSEESAIAAMRAAKPTIDLQWRDRIYRLHFGTGISLNQDDQMRVLRRNRNRSSARQNYLQHVADMSEARLNLLSKDTYFYTSGVAVLLSHAGSAVSGAEVAALRRWGYLLAVPDHGRWLYPSFQFDPISLSVPSGIAEVNGRLRTSYPWETLSWWHLPRPSLGNSTIASIAHTDDGAMAIDAALARLRQSA